MEIITNSQEMQKRSNAWLSAGKRIGFVPTMGALHAGHLSLVKRAKAENDITVVSIFVNPAQFAPHEDYARYPKNLEKDLEILKPYAVDVVFHPDARDMFPPDFQTRIHVEKISEPLYGKVRPHFFSGVAVVVLKLFHIINPTNAYFGEKDYQQYLVIRQMSKDLSLDVNVLPCPIVREPDGLAMSSRNAYLSPDQRRQAALLYKALQTGSEMIKKGERNPECVIDSMKKTINEIPQVKIDYIAIADPQTLKTLSRIENEAFLGLCVQIGETRLIDSLVVGVNTPIP